MLRFCALAVLLAVTPAMAKDITVEAGPNAQERLQSALLDAKPGDTVRIGAGRFELTDGLSLDVNGVTVRGAGTRLPVSFTDPAGQRHSISYAVPNQNQCKDCHGLAGQVTPIGIKARYLNHGGQLEKLLAAGMLDRLPPDAPRVARWDDRTAPLDQRARAWLEINCAHCHNPEGAASNSGLFLDLARTDPEQRGLFKRPTAAGRGAGTRDFDIVPGDPQASILLYRMESTDPGIAMPELGRATVHKEGVALVRAWIESMPKR